MNENIINEVSNDMGIKSTQVESVLKLLSEGNTIPFIAIMNNRINFAPNQDTYHHF